MAKVSEMRESKFLKQTDVGAGALFTVESCEQHNVAKDGADPELKWCLTFAECDKPLVLNSTNIQLCQNIFASDDTDDWVSKRIVLYAGPNVSFQGKLVGGIRVRAQKVKTAAVPTSALTKTKPAPMAVAEPEGESVYLDDIPF